MFTVVWRQPVITELARIYTRALETGGDTLGITRATDRADQLLRVNPTELGESRAGIDRVLVVAPLTVTYEVYEDERVVLIMRVVYRRRR